MNRDSFIGGNGGEKAWLEDGFGLVHIALFEAAVAQGVEVQRGLAVEDQF